MVSIPKKFDGGNGDGKNFARLFEHYGVSFGAPNGTEVLAEECPFCQKAKFYLDTATGQYKCFSEDECGAAGNEYTFIRWAYATALDNTTDADYQGLKASRDLPLQTLKRHGLAWDSFHGCWMIPDKSEAGEVLNITEFYPKTGKKLSLHCMDRRLYGRDQLSQDPTRLLFLCEGAFDAMALDHHLCEKKTRKRYDILAVPAAAIFKKSWLKYLEGRKVRLCLDNDNAGRKGQERIATMVREAKTKCKLFALDWPDGYPDGCDMRDLVDGGVNVVEFTNDHCKQVASGTWELVMVRGDRLKHDPPEWMWAGHIPFKSYTDLSGGIGSQKSMLMRDLAARGTTGRPMPNCTTAKPPFVVLYFTSEDPAGQIHDLFKLAGGDLAKLHVHDIVDDGNLEDLLDHLKEVEALINATGARLVVFDAFNSFFGGDPSTDANARRTLSGKLHSLARRTRACIAGIRNWGRVSIGTASQNAMGAISLSHVARCTMSSRKVDEDPEIPGMPPRQAPAPMVLPGSTWLRHPPTRFLLEFERVTGAPTPRPVPFVIHDRSTCEEDWHMRVIEWGLAADSPIVATLSAAMEKGSAKRSR
jgi:hypothetical protein